MVKKLLKKFHHHYHFKYKGNYRHAKKLFIFDMLLLSLAIVMLGASLFLFFWKPSITDMVDLDISLGDNRIISGEYVHLIINYKNRSEQKLLGTTLSLNLPSGFQIDRLKTPSTTFNDKSIFPNIKNIKSGEKSSVEIYGWFWSEPNKDNTIIARLSYTTSETNNREQKINRYLLKLPGSVIQSNLTIPTSAFIGQSVEYKYMLKSNAKQTLNNISIVHNWSNEIIDKKYNDISIRPNEVKIVTGTINLEKNIGKHRIQFTPQIKINETQITQIPVFADIDILSPDLYSQVNFSKAIKYADIFSIMPIDVSWKNNSKLTIDNLRLVLTVNYPQMIDWEKTALENNIRYSGNSLIIDGQARTKLKNILSQNGENFIVNIYTKGWFEFKNEKNTYLEIIPELQLPAPSNITPVYTQKGTGDKLQIATQLKVDQQIRFYTPEGDQIGRLPLPPKVGQTTKYWVFIKIYNQINDVNNVELTAKLADGVTFTGKESVTIGPKLTYKKSNNTLNWNYPKLNALGTTGIHFEIQVTPTSKQVGQKLPIIEYVNIKAKDNNTSKIFDITTKKLDNTLADDDRGRLKGNLVEK